MTNRLAGLFTFPDPVNTRPRMASNLNIHHQTGQPNCKLDSIFQPSSNTTQTRLEPTTEAPTLEPSSRAAQQEQSTAPAKPANKQSNPRIKPQNPRCSWELYGLGILNPIPPSPFRCPFRRVASLLTSPPNSASVRNSADAKCAGSEKDHADSQHKVRGRSSSTTLSPPAEGNLVSRSRNCPINWVWVNNRYPEWNPGKWKQILKPAVPWRFNFDPHPTMRTMTSNLAMNGKSIARRPRTAPARLQAPASPCRTSRPCGS